VRAVDTIRASHPEAPISANQDIFVFSAENIAGAGALPDVSTRRSCAGKSVSDPAGPVVHIGCSPAPVLHLRRTETTTRNRQPGLVSA
jgi:hypothetical protein